ncbi:hypothetical protein JCM10450v2_001730 [Rhodotorula kratochvilovae]
MADPKASLEDSPQAEGAPAGPPRDAPPGLIARIFRRRRPSPTSPSVPAGDVDRHEKPVTHDFGFLPIPPGCRYDPETFRFTPGLNWLMAGGATLTVANVYWAQPVLVQLAAHFDVPYDTVTRIPSLVQGGYLVGLVLITPLGDLLPRRPLLLALIFVGAFLALGQALAPTFLSFEILTFLIGIVTVPPQILVPLAADLAPPAIRASCVSTVLSGLIGGMVFGRFFSGILARYTGSPLNVFYFAFATQLALAVGLWWKLPAFPKKQTGLNYPQILWSMVKLFCTKPALTQACFVGYLSCVVMVSWWTTLTFLLAGSPFNLNSFEIGLFGLTGICAIAWAPYAGKMTDRIHPWVTTLLALLLQLCNQALALGTARLSLAPVVICCILVDICHQSSTIGNQQRFFAVDPLARSRVNGVYMAFTFLGQTTGSSVGPKLFLNDGWRASYALNVAFVAGAIAVLCARGPHAKGWVGWEGVWSLRREPKGRGTVEGDQEKGEEEEEEKEVEAKEEEVGQETAVELEEAPRIQVEAPDALRVDKT